MKKLFAILTCAALLLTGGCDNFDHLDLTNRVNDLEERVAALEEWCNQMNTNITSLQALLDALENSDYITSVTELTENGKVVGYKISFAKGNPITIYHGEDGAQGEQGEQGQDGKTPVIGVRQDSDGVWYWTLNGEWLTDDNDNQLPAVGEAGANGITPQLAIFYGTWYVSYDDGPWIELGPATGEDGENGEKGEKGDSFFRSVDTGSSDYVIFTLTDGTEIKLPRCSQLAIELETGNPIYISPNETLQIGYTITGNITDEVTVEVLASGDVKAKIEPATATTGQLVITAGDTIDKEYTRVVVLVSEGTNTIVKNFAVEKTPQFPDPIFRAYVLEKFDKDQDGEISEEEAADVGKIDVEGSYEEWERGGEGITSVKGIELFPNLTTLNINYNQVTTVDVSQNTKLTRLEVENNQLTTLDVSKNTELTTLFLRVNHLTTLDVGQNTKLETLYCDSNQLTELNVSQNKKLETLFCGSNLLTELEVSVLPVLRSLDCSGNQLTKLDVSQNAQLMDLFCGFNPLTTLDVTQNPGLRYLYCWGNQLEELDVTSNPGLKGLVCNDNRLTTLDVTQNPLLEHLTCQGNQLTTLDVSNTSLAKDSYSEPLQCRMESLQTLTLKQGQEIKHIYPNRNDSYIHPNTRIVFVE